MPRPPRIQTPPVDRSSVESQIVALVRDFQSSWQDFFCEEELHAHFYHRCRDRFPRYKTNDGIETTSFHHRYETFWRYLDGDRFAGDYAAFDFVVLRDTFIQQRTHVDVMNHYELIKKVVRCYPGTDLQTRDAAIYSAIEIKLVVQGENATVETGEVNRLEDRMLDAARKLAAERIQRAYIVGLSQGPPPTLQHAYALVAMCLQRYHARYPDGELAVVVATPQQTVLGGDWSEEVEFPNVVVQGGWPVPARR